MSTQLARTEQLIDARTGLLTDVVRQPRDQRMPAGWISYGAHVGRSDRWAPWRADGFGFGAALGDAAAARAAAIGEAVERYCGNAIPATLLRASWSELRASGDDALDPQTLALYSPRQYASPGFPFVPFTRDLSVSWVPGTDLATGRELWVPASLTYLDYFHGCRADEAPTHSLMYSGIATGPDLTSAQRGAVEELLERDACTIWWASGAPTCRIDDGDLITGQLGRPGVGDELRIRLLHIPSEFDVPVAAAFLEQTRGEHSPALVAFGSACRADPATAATKALVEALGLLQLTRQLDDPHAEVWRAVAAGEIERHVFLPHRADRAYRDLAGDDYRNLTDLPPVAQLYLDPRMQDAPLQRLRPNTALPLPGIPVADPERYVQMLHAAGIRVVAVDLTTPEVAETGLVVVRVIAAGLIGNAPPAFALRGGRRLYDVPARLGWSTRPLTEPELVSDPIPLA